MTDHYFVEDVAQVPSTKEERAVIVEEKRKIELVELPDQEINLRGQSTQ